MQLRSDLPKRACASCGASPARTEASAPTLVGGPTTSVGFTQKGGGIGDHAAVVIRMRDGLVFRSLPFFTGSLAFMSACGGGSSTDSGATTGDSGGESTSTVTADDTASTTNVDTSEGGTTAITADSSDSSAGGGSSSDSGDPECGPASQCTDEAPVGWFGPVIHAQFPEGTEPPPCPEAYSDPGPTLLAGFNDPGPAICGCECELSMMQNCYASIYYGGVAPTCNDWNNNAGVSDNCINLDVGGFVRFDANGYNQGFCEETQSEVIPPLLWESAIRTCRLDTPFPCGDGGVCTPDPVEGFENIWCIYQQGDLDCPAGPFSAKELFYSAAEDTRACSNCTCGTAGTSCTDYTLDVYAGADCAGEPVASLGVDSCSQIDGASVAGNFGGGTPCPVTEPSLPEGAVTAMGAFTFCCQP